MTHWFWHRLVLAPALVAVAIAACSGEDEQPPRIGVGGASGAGPSGGSAGRGGAAGSGGAGALDGGAATGGTAGTGRDGGGSGGTSGSAGTPGDGGADVDAGPPVCGNGVAQSGEPCDGSDVRGQSCVNYGFERGELGCEDCSLDFSACVGSENCADGRDNDGDQAVDCADEDCRAGCENSCSAPIVLPDPALGIPGQTNGHASQIAPGCLLSAVSSGAETVYTFTAARSGVLDVRLASLLVDLNVSVRTTCNNGPELACSEKNAGSGAVEELNLPINQGETVLIVVDGTGDVAGRYTLDVESRAVECGDSHRDPTEGCDDGNRNPADGCNSNCELEPDETEPNGTTGEATPYSGFPFFASIGAAGDVDVYSIDVPNANSTITAETFDMGDGTCAHHVLDSLVEILAPDGTTVLASDDDGGDGFCSRATASGVGAGTHFVRVRASGVATAFPYKLNVAVTR